MAAISAAPCFGFVLGVVVGREMDARAISDDGWRAGGRGLVVVVVVGFSRLCVRQPTETHQHARAHALEDHLLRLVGPRRVHAPEHLAVRALAEEVPDG
jgi:hypothetical protein